MSSLALEVTSPPKSLTEFEAVFALDQLNNWDETLKAISQSDNPLSELRRVAEDCLSMEQIPSEEMIDIALIELERREFIGTGSTSFYGWFDEGFYYLHSRDDEPQQFRIPAKVAGHFKSAAKTCSTRIELLQSRELWQQAKRVEHVEIVAWPDIEKRETSFIGYLKRIHDGQILGYYIWSPRELNRDKLKQSTLISGLLEVRERGGGKGKKRAKHFPQLEGAKCSGTKASRKRCMYEYKIKLSSCFPEQIREFQQISLVQTFRSS